MRGKKRKTATGRNRGKRRKEYEWILRAVGKSLGIGGMIAWLFFQSVWGLLCVPVCMAITIVREKKKETEKRTETEQERFAEFLGFLKEALSVGYSLEQAVGEGRKGMLTSLKDEDTFVQSVLQMERKMQLGTAVEAAFSEWAETALCEDIKDFAEVLFIAKRTGGAVQQVIENTERVIRDKQETLRHIRAVLHSREYEAKVMKCMPFAMLLYLQLSMSEFLAPLYHNPVGACVMIFVLILYFVLCMILDRVTAISL